MLQELTAEVEKIASAVVRDIHTALPGKIVSFDPEKAVAVVQPKGKFRTEDGTPLDYPAIPDVPVIFPYCQASGVGVTFPVKPGDNCLIVVSEIELDEWRSGAESKAPLRFDLTSAIALPGLMLGGGDAIRKATAQDAVVIKAKSAEMVISDRLVSITAKGGLVSVTAENIDIRGAVTVHGDFTTEGGVVRLN